MNNRYLVVLQYLSHMVYHLYKMQYCPALMVIVLPIEAGKICFELLVIHLMSIIHHFGLHKLIPKLHESLSMLTKMAAICSKKVRSVRRRLHNSVFNTKTNIWSLFWPSVYTQTMKMHMQNEDF